MGWTRGKTGICTTHIHGHKYPSLCVKQGKELIVVANFRNKEMEELFNKTLDYLIEGKKWEKQF